MNRDSYTGLIEQLRLQHAAPTGDAVMDSLAGQITKMCSDAANWIEQLERENLELRHDLDRAMANHVADINAVPREAEAGAVQETTGAPAVPAPDGPGGEVKRLQELLNDLLGAVENIGSWSVRNSPGAIAARSYFERYTTGGPADAASTNAGPHGDIGREGDYPENPADSQPIEKTR